MPRFLDTIGNADIAIFVCDRCHFKRPHSTAQSDPNFPGLRVCSEGCADEKDPYRLAARKTERITIRFPRPDVNIDQVSNAIITTGNNSLELSPENNTQIPTLTDNLDSISTSTGQ